MAEFIEGEVNIVEQAGPAFAYTSNIEQADPALQSHGFFNDR
ncbi:hypothetical protein [Massilia sp. BHUDP2]